MNSDFSHDLIQSLGWALLHFLWQGSLIAMLLGIALSVLRVATPQKRYLAGCAALALMTIAPVVTFFHVRDVTLQSPIFDNLSIPTRSAVASKTKVATTPKAVFARESFVQKLNFGQRLDDFLPWMVVLWAVGVAALSVRLTTGWLVLNRLRRAAATALDGYWLARFAELKRRLGIARPVQLVQSALVEVPSVIGWLKPMILLPASCMAGLSPAQLESIIAHELAHVRRHDYLVNLLQSVVETLLFYHPAVWWVSRRIREERELCCDDLAVEVCGNRVNYARALAALEEMRRPANLALAANAPPLLLRIQRIAGKSQSGSVNRAVWPVIGSAIVLSFVVIWIAWRSNHSVTEAAHNQHLTSIRHEMPRFRSFQVNLTKFPVPLDTMLQEVQNVSLRNYFSAGRVSSNSSLPQSHAAPEWLIMHKDGSLGLPNPTEADKKLETGLLQFFSTVGVNFDTDDETVLLREFSFTTIGQDTSLNITAAESEVDAIQKALDEIGAIFKPMPYPPYPLSIGRRIQLKNPLAKNSTPPPSVQLGQIDPNTGLPAGNASSSRIDPYTGLPAGNGAASQIDPHSGLPKSSLTAPPLDPTTGLPKSSVSQVWHSSDTAAKNSVEGQLHAEGKKWVGVDGEITVGSYVHDILEGRFGQPAGRGAIGKVVELGQDANGVPGAKVDFGKRYVVGINLSELSLVKIEPWKK